MRSVVNTFTGFEFERIQRTNDFVGFNIEHVKIDHRGADIAMSEQFLNVADVGSRFEEMGRETVSEGVGRNAFIEAEF